MKKFNFASLLILTILSVHMMSAQSRNCGTMLYLEQQTQNNPNLKQAHIANEIKIQNWILSKRNNSLNSVITIPTVVHIVYNNNNENITDLQIQSQIDILNEDFRRLNADTTNTPLAFQSLAADCGIEFCLANTDPNGNTTTGITRTSTSQSSFSTNDDVKYTSSGGIDSWNTSEYLNIWVCDLSGSLLGYAQFPGGSASSDGVVCDYQYFGNIGTATSPYDLGRTTTHEVGHWLNLRHIWGDSNCGNDFCNDTPEHSSSNYGCPNYPSTSNCNGNGSYGDMFMNYMDYTNDGCMNMFTLDQKTRMIAAINTSRSGLLTSNGCTNTDFGCTDSLAYNFSSIAIIDNGSCCYNAGCMDQTAINYDSTACFDDGSCIAPVLGCTNPNSPNFDPTANTTLAYGAELDNSFASGGYFNGDQHQIFDALKACVIKSAVIYAEAANTITFELRNSNGNVLDDTTLNVVAGQQRIPLNFNVPVGTDMQLGVASGALSSDGLYRNNTGASYPYNIASAINITSSSASGNNGNNAFSYYYFYYDIEVETPCLITSNPSWDCDGQGNCSDPGTGNGQYTSLASCQNNCITPSWDCDGQGNCFDPGTGNGQYSSLASCQNNCITPSWDCEGSMCFNPGNGLGAYLSLIDCETVCNNVSFFENPTINDLKLYPNPSTQKFNLSFNTTIVFDIKIKLTNVLGKKLMSKEILKFVGKYDLEINLKNKPKGIYFLEIELNDVSLYKKLILQ